MVCYCGGSGVALRIIDLIRYFFAPSAVIRFIRFVYFNLVSLCIIRTDRHAHNYALWLGSNVFHDVTLKTKQR